MSKLNRGNKSAGKAPGIITCINCLDEDHQLHGNVFNPDLKKLEVSTLELLISLIENKEIDPSTLKTILVNIIDGQRDFEVQKHLKVSGIDPTDLPLDFNELELYLPTTKILESIISRVSELLPILKRIQHVISQPYSVRVGSNVSSQTVEITLANQLRHCIELNFHNVAIDGVPCTCSFHHESLGCHLVSAMLITFSRLPVELEDDKKFANVLATLCHDIGKPASIVKVYQKNWLSFPAHGEGGAALMLEAWTDEMGVSTDLWRCICAAIRTHMCGYHEVDPDNSLTQEKWDAIRFQDPLTKQILYNMSFGDDKGRSFYESSDLVQEVKKSFGEAMDSLEKAKVLLEKGRQILEKNDNSFEQSRPAFFTHIQEPYKPLDSPFGRLILIRGQSGVGKSELAKKLVKMIPNSICCSRDVSMAIEQGFPEELHGKAYLDARKKYEEERRGGKVNDLFWNMIKEGLLCGKTVIVDSVILLYDSIKFVLIDNNLLNKVPILAIDVIRNNQLTQEDADRKGLTLDDQVYMSVRPSVHSAYPSGSQNVIASRHSMSNPASRSPDIVVQLVNWNEELCRVLDAVKLFCGITCTLSEAKTKAVVHESIHAKESNLSIIELVNQVYQEVGYNTDAMLRALQTMLSLLDRNIHKQEGIIQLKYREDSRNWSDPARECRDVQLYLEYGRWHIFTMLLQRGAEVLTRFHHGHGITETENQSSDDISHFSPRQQIFMNQLIEGNSKTKVVASNKHDGAIAGITIFPKGSTRDLMFRNIVDGLEGPDRLFHQNLIDLSDYLELPFDIVLRTSGTVLVNSNMLDYVVTAILVSVCGISYEELAGMNLNTHDLVVYFTQQGRVFVDKLLQLWERSTGMRDSSDSSITFMFEVICQDRKGVATDSSEHTELACIYNKCMFSFFGARVNADFTSGRFFPHYQFDEMLHGLFEQPCYWKIHGTEQINTMLQDMNRVIHGEITEEEYYELYPVSNLGVCEKFFDAEGFVLYDHPEDDDLFSQEPSYNKGKTDAYYKGHNMNQSNLPQILTWGETARSYFPEAQKVYNKFMNIFPRAKIEDALEMMFKVAYTAVDSEKNPARIQKPSKDDGKKKRGFEDLPPIIQFKNSVNNNDFLDLIIGDVWSGILTIFETNRPMPDNFSFTLKSILMDIHMVATCDNIKEKIAEIIQVKYETLKSEQTKQSKWQKKVVPMKSENEPCKWMKWFVESF